MSSCIRIPLRVRYHLSDGCQFRRSAPSLIRWGSLFPILQVLMLVFCGSSSFQAVQDYLCPSRRGYAFLPIQASQMYRSRINHLRLDFRANPTSSKIGANENIRMCKTPRHQQRRETVCPHMSLLNEEPQPNEATHASVNGMVGSDIGNSTQQQSHDAGSITQKHLVDYGLAWVQTRKEIFSNLSRVPGCVATVYISATPVFAQTDSNQDQSFVNIIGNADAVVSRGLLALLSEYLTVKNNFTVDQILNLDPEKITDQLGVRPMLSKGRNDGVSNMLRVIQQQLSASVASQSMIPSSFSAVPDPNDQRNGEKRRKRSVALLLSGGVDSSVALRLLQQEGYDVTAFYLKIWLEDELAHLGTCPWEDDVRICQEVCRQANVRLQIVSLQEEYHKRVMQHTLQEAAMGRTPNPDILCNSRVKFGCFLEHLRTKEAQDDDVDFDFIASGHYAQLVRPDDDSDDVAKSGVQLFRAPDPVKDQSYFLCALSQQQLKKLLFPIGHLQKNEVRRLAEEFALPNRHRPDSQGLCFLGKVKFRDFLQSHLGESPGDIVDAFTGEVIGRHDGVWYHTVGQRKGIGNSLFPKATAKGPWYVVAKDPSRKIIFASNQYDEQIFTQARSEFHVENLHWIAGYAPTSPTVAAKTHIDNGTRTSSYRLWMKIRHGPRLVAGTLKLKHRYNNDNRSKDGSGRADSHSDNGDTGEAIVKLDVKDGGLAPGQYVVFYTATAECLGGGIISEQHWSKFLTERPPRELEVKH